MRVPHAQCLPRREPTGGRFFREVLELESRLKTDDEG